MIGQADLGAWIEIATGRKLWSIQHRICQALSKPGAQVAVPSCNSSGKTHLAGRIALAFFDAFQPGTPCPICESNGLTGCAGSKVITTSSKWEHLRDNLWGELRTAYAQVARRVGYPGKLYQGDLRLEVGPRNFIIGQSSNTAEGMQGYHQAHKLILGDEATSVDDEVQAAITGLLASGDARLLLIFNPTTDDTFAAKVARADTTETIKIRVWDTPNFTGEPVPEGANLATQAWLDLLESRGMGPGTYEWTTRVEADFWTLGEGVLIPSEWVDRNVRPGSNRDEEMGIVQLGVDLASYGTDENVIAIRWGKDLVDLRAYPSMRQDLFWQGPVMDAVRHWGATYLVYDADGVGAGVVGEAQRIADATNCQVIPFRGAKAVNEQHLNARATWWWNLRRRFENDDIKLRIPDDSKLRSQLSQVTYTIQNGKIKVETKREMKQRGLDSPDRADAVVYSFAITEGMAQEMMPPPPQGAEAEALTDTKDLSELAMWRRLRSSYREPQRDVNAVTGCTDDW